jgi:O-antigen ligase
MNLDRIKSALSRCHNQEAIGLAIGLLSIAGWFAYQNVPRVNLIVLAAAAAIPLWYLIRYPILGAMAYAFAVMFNLIFYFPTAPLLILLGSTVAIIFNKIIRRDPTWRVTPFVVWSTLLLLWWSVTITWISAYDYFNFGFNPDAILMALVFTEVIDSVKKLKLVVGAAVLGALSGGIIIIYELVSVVRSGYLAQGAWAAKTVAGSRYFGNWKVANPMAYSMMVGISLSLMLFQKHKNKLGLILSIGGLFLCLTSVFLSLTRGALMWTALLFILYAIAVEYRRTILAIIGLATIIIFLTVPVSIFSRFTHLGKGRTDSSLTERSMLVSADLDLMVEWFPIGAGAGTFYQTSSDRLAHRSSAIGSHNSYMDVAAEMGLPGIIMFIGMVVSLWQATTGTAAGLRNSAFLKNYGIAARAGLIAILLALLTENMIGFWPFWLFFTIIGLRPALIHAEEVEASYTEMPKGQLVPNAN